MNTKLLLKNTPYHFWILIFFFGLPISACQDTTPIPDDRTRNASDSTIIDSTERQTLSTTEVAPKINLDSILNGHDSSWVDLTQMLPKARFDIRYASTNNFMELQVYECAGCFTRLEVAKALIKIQTDLDTLGLVLKFFDCYRPSAAQWKLWNKMPDARYVHPPTQGSMHSRGNALDLTLVVDSSGQELEMGTPFDYFGKEAYWNYTAHPKNVTENRKLLRQMMYKYGFVTVATEWWHFAYNNKKFPLSNMQWTCDHH
jgi:D-alanyl-D-alanine dipeptidase